MSARNDVMFFGVSESGSSQFDTYIEAGNMTLPCSSFISIFPATSATTSLTLSAFPCPYNCSVLAKEVFIKPLGE